MSKTTFFPQEIIAKKRDGLALTEAEIAFFVKGISDNSIIDAQAAAFAMAVFFQGMSLNEMTHLTQAMAHSGQVINWNNYDLNGPLIDKHSTGGIGDKVSLILVPLMAACGAYMPKYSGKALAHTGGTIDKLASIPGFDLSPDLKTIQSIVKNVGCIITGTNQNLAPADKRLYAIRDITATVESMPLIAASVLCKKLASGCEYLLLESTFGSGALVHDYDQAKHLASLMVQIARQANLPTVAMMTDMNQCLGHSVGNALELIETIEFLKNQTRHPRLTEVILKLGSELCLLSHLAADEKSARELLLTNLNNGVAAEKFAAMVSALNGPHDLLDNPLHYLKPAPVQKAIYAKTSGYIHKIEARQLGAILLRLGGMRVKPDDTIDYRVGLTNVKGIGDYVDPQIPLAIVHANNESIIAEVALTLNQIFTLKADKPIVSNPIPEKISPR